MDGRLTTLSTNGKMLTRSRLCLVFIFPGWQWETIVNSGNDEDKVIFIRFTLEQYKSAYCNVITNTGEETLENFWEGGRRTFWFLCERWNWRLNVFSLFNSKLHLQYSKMTSTDVRHNYFLSLAKVEWIFLLDAEELLLNENSSQSSWGQNVNTVHWNQFEQNNIYTSIIYQITWSGEYSCLKVELIFKREFSYYLITIYVPCCMLVIVSWVTWTFIYFIHSQEVLQCILYFLRPRHKLNKILEIIRQLCCLCR